MAKNQVQFQQGYSLFEFMDDFGTEDKCEQALFNWRFPAGYVCRDCGNTTYCQLKCRKLLYEIAFDQVVYGYPFTNPI